MKLRIAQLIRLNSRYRRCLRLLSCRTRSLLIPGFQGPNPVGQQPQVPVPDLECVSASTEQGISWGSLALQCEICAPESFALGGWRIWRDPGCKDWEIAEQMSGAIKQHKLLIWTVMLTFLGIWDLTRGKDICPFMFCATIKIFLAQKGQHPVAAQ